jgi:hypothetical protein
MQTSPWTATPFIESVQFDNLGGTRHNVNGNLLGVDFGSAAGGQIYSFGTTGSDPLPAGQLLADTGTGMGGYTSTGKTRIGEIAVSPDNTKVAVTFYDDGVIGEYNYTPGNSLGTGAPALSGGHVGAAGVIDAKQTQGIAWQDNNTILTYQVGTTTAGTSFLYKTDASTLNSTVAASIPVPPTGIGGTSIAYNPDVSPYIYLMWATGNSLVTASTQLSVLDTSYNVIKTVSFDGATSAGGMNSARSIALDKAGNLYISEFGGGPNATDNAMIDFLPAANVLNPTTLTDESAIDYYFPNTATSHASFPYIDIGFAPAAPAGVAGDYNNDGKVDAADYAIWRSHLGQTFALPNRDPTASGAVAASDYTYWASHFGNGSPGSGSLGAGSVPEPATIAMLLTGVAGLGLLIRRRLLG